jgi:Domain of unknown function (DUF4158)
MPVEFLTDEQAASYGRFVGAPAQVDLERYCFLDDADLALIAEHRGEHSKFGVRASACDGAAVGRFLTDPLDVPTAVVDYVAAQLDVADPSVVKRYTERRSTRFEHQAEICAVYGYRDFRWPATVLATVRFLEAKTDDGCTPSTADPARR